MILSVAILVLLLAGAMAYIGSPLLAPGRAGRREEEDAAFFEHETSLRLLRDLEHDRQTGKMDEEQYLLEKGRVEARGIAALRELDSLRAGATLRGGARATAREPAAERRER